MNYLGQTFCNFSYRGEPKRVTYNRNFLAFIASEDRSDVASPVENVLVKVNGSLRPSERHGGGNPSAEQLNCTSEKVADPVDTFSGNFYETYSDLTIPGRGCPLSLTRTYNAQASARSGRFGYGWDFSYGMNISQDPGSGEVTVTQENGSQVFFAQSGNTYVAPPRVMASLTRNPDGTWTFVRYNKKTFTFDASGRLTAERDLNNYETTVSYPDASTIVARDSAGRTITFSLSGNLIVSATDSATPARSVFYGYDGSGNLVSVTDVGGGVTRFTYDANHQMLSVREPKYANDSTSSPSPTVQNEYDSYGRVVSQSDQLGRTTSFNYNSSTGETRITDPAGNVQLDEYDDGLRVASTRGYGTPQAARWSYTFDPETFVITRACDPKDHCESRTFDARGNMLTNTDALDRTTTYTYSSTNDVTSVTDPKGVKTTKTYDQSGNLLTISRPLKDSSGATISTQTTTLTYGGAFAGDVMSATDPNGKTWRYTYDAFGNQTSETAPPTPENASGNKTTRTFNANTGWLLTSTSPKGNLSGANAAAFTTKYTYDAFGRTETVTDPLWSSANPTKHRVTSHFDANGNLDYEIDANGNRTNHTFDAANQLIQTTRADGTTLRWDYWADGSLRREYNGKGDATTYQYDPLGNPTSISDPLGRATTMSHDAAGNLTQRIAPGGSCAAPPKANCATYTYDQANQLTGLSYADGLTPAVSNITYDASGQRTAMTDGTGTSTWTWDSLNRLTSSKDGFNATVSYGYDLASNQTSITYPGGNKLTKNFDAAGRNDWLQDWKSNKTSFAYDANSNLKTTTRPASTGVIDTNTYDNADAMLSIATKKGTTNRATFTYTRNGAQQLATSTTTGITEPSQAYSYNSLNELTKSGPTSSQVTYGYDQVDRLTARNSASTQSYDAASQLCWSKTAVVANPSCATVPSSSTRFAYDSRGNRTVKTPPTGTATTFSYNQNNQMTAVTGKATYAYDGDGLRMTKTLTGGAASRMVWDRSTEIPNLIGDGANTYIYGPDGTPLEQISSSGVVTFLHHDQLGSTRLITSTSGANVASYTFDPYGT